MRSVPPVDRLRTAAAAAPRHRSTAESSTRLITQPSRSALLPLTAVGSPALPREMVKPESDVRSSRGTRRGSGPGTRTTPAATRRSHRRCRRPRNRCPGRRGGPRPRAAGPAAAAEPVPSVRRAARRRCPTPARPDRRRPRSSRPAEVSRSICSSSPVRPAPASMSVVALLGRGVHLLPLAGTGPLGQPDHAVGLPGDVGGDVPTAPFRAAGSARRQSSSLTAMVSPEQPLGRPGDQSANVGPAGSRRRQAGFMRHTLALRRGRSGRERDSETVSGRTYDVRRD